MTLAPGPEAGRPSCLLCSPPFPMSPQWIIAELACYTYSMVVVPLYDTLGPGAIRYIINTGKPPTAPLCHSLSGDASGLILIRSAFFRSQRTLGLALWLKLAS